MTPKGCGQGSKAGASRGMAQPTLGEQGKSTDGSVRGASLGTQPTAATPNIHTLGTQRRVQVAATLCTVTPQTLFNLRGALLPATLGNPTPQTHVHPRSARIGQEHAHACVEHPCSHFACVLYAYAAWVRSDTTCSNEVEVCCIHLMATHHAITVIPSHHSNLISIQITRRQGHV